MKTGQHQQCCNPKGNLGTVPRHPVWVQVGNQIVSEVHILQLHSLPRFHVIVQTFNSREEPGSLVEVIVFWTSLGKTEALGEAQPCCRMSLQAPELTGHVLHPTAAVVELPLGHVGVHSLVVDLRGRVGIPVTVTRNLPRPPDKVVADGLPPNARLGLAHPQHSLVHAVHIHFALQLAPGPAVPALGHVDDIEHEQEGQGDVDVAVGARAVVVDHRVPADAHPGGGALRGGEGGGESSVEADLGDAGQLTPGHHAQAAVHKEREEQAAPVRFPADAGT